MARSSISLAIAVTVVWAAAAPARAQLTSKEEERLQILSDPDALKKTAEKDKSRAPFEFFRSQVTPFDVLPLVKPRQWSTVVFDLRANQADYDGILQSSPLRLPGMPVEMIYGRVARLVKEQRTRLSVQMMVPRLPQGKELGIELLQPGFIRADELWQMPVRLLPPQQMLVVVMSKESTNQYAHWNRFPSVVPSTVDRDDPMTLDYQRYFRMVLPEEPEQSFLSAHPLTWAPISHMIWDGLPPDSLSVAHQQALLDWLHWGGQIVIMGGAGPTFSIFRDSFLGPYLPAEPSGENRSLGDAELRPLSEAYPPAFVPAPGADPSSIGRGGFDVSVLGQGRYLRPAPIHAPPARPLVVSGLKPLAGSVTVSLGEGSPHLLAVENRVGRGRITMLTVNLNDPSLVSWPGLDTLIRRVVLRRPEEGRGGAAEDDGSGKLRAYRKSLEAPDLSWYRITSRDVAAERDAQGTRSEADKATMKPDVPPAAKSFQTTPTADGGTFSTEAEETANARIGVAEWRDTMPLPRLSRELLEKASGITVPGKPFVLKVILAYILAVVPLNWLICRTVLRRKEWAWFVVPLLALGFAVGVERVAAYDLGYDSACDEIDLLELHGGYHRAHLSRFASLYTTARTKYTISYPNDPTALALPFNNERSIGGEEVSAAVWQSFPVAALRNMAVQPRSLAMFRAEQMLSLPGTIRLEDRDGKRMIVNETELELLDAVILDAPVDGRGNETHLGTIAPRSTIELSASQPPPSAASSKGFDGPDPAAFLEVLRKSWELRPENSGELRLVAWVGRPVDGQTFEPPLDRHRGLTAVVVHLRYGSPPSPDGPRYNLLADRAERVSLPPASDQPMALLEVNGRQKSATGKLTQPLIRRASPGSEQ